MDLRVSYRWLKEHLKTDVKPEEVARLLTLHAHTVDRVEHVKPVWRGVVTAKILEIKPHPSADKLRLARVTDGKQEQVVVCGAPNIEVGQIVPFAAVGATVLEWKTGKTWTVTVAKIRGVESQGMLCATDELGVGDDHGGIWILPPDTPLGVPLEKVYPAEDIVFHVEVTSNRPDCMSVYGLAREAAAVLPRAKLTRSRFPKLAKPASSIPLKVQVAEPKLCPRYQAVVMTGVTVGPSPLWLQQRLIAAGQRPINNLVDITNYVRLEYGNPLHVFDYKKLDGQQIVVRRAKAGESLLALDGKTYSLTTSDVVITDTEMPVAIAGVMGGENSAATASTKTIIVEVANFDPVSVRKTSRRLGLISDSSLLFEKGLPPRTTELALARTMELTKQIAGGQVASVVYDAKRPLPKPQPIAFEPAVVGTALGAEVKPAVLKRILVRLGFSVAGSKTWRVTPPWWRTGDVAESHDLVEEIARVQGYHNLPASLPTGMIPARALDPLLQLSQSIRSWLVGQGFTEVQSYALVPGKILEDLGLPLTAALRVANPLSAEFEYLRPTLSASLLSVAGQNVKRFSHQQLFELANIYQPKAKDLPDELPTLAFLITDRQDSFFAAKGMIEALRKHLGVHDFQFVAERTAPAEFWQPRAQLVAGGKTIGRFGPVLPAVLERFGIRQPLVLCGLSLPATIAMAHPSPAYQSIPAFPPIDRDLALVVDAGLQWQRIDESIAKFHPLIRSVAFLSSYQAAMVGAGKKSVACRIEFRADDRTLAAGEVDGIMEKLITKFKQEFSATIR